LLFRDEALPEQIDPVAPRPRSVTAHSKERDQRTPDALRAGGFPVLRVELAP
jgi:hypothetical protein